MGGIRVSLFGFRLFRGVRRFKGVWFWFVKNYLFEGFFLVGFCFLLVLFSFFIVFLGFVGDRKVERGRSLVVFGKEKGDSYFGSGSWFLFFYI